MDYTREGLDQIVSFTRSYPRKSHSGPQAPFNPATDLPEYKLNRVNEWEHSSSEVITTDTSDLPKPLPRHPCEVLAEHWDEVFEGYRFASHLFDSDVRSLSESSTCALCRLLSQSPMIANKVKSKIAVYTVNLLSERERLAAKDYSPDSYVIGLTISVGDHMRPERHLKGLSQGNHRHDREGLLVPAIDQNGEHGYASPYIARIIDTEQTDLDLLQRWITTCEAGHVACQKARESIDHLGVVLTVVDCQTESKIPLARGDRYLALSYRWGKPPECDDPWAVSAAPRTVRDAMALTLKLGFRYLWVDRHCIDQNNEVNKARDLAIMDHIYENASLTIVAMAGTDDTYGLPGVGTKPIIPRNKQAKAVLGGHTIISLNPDILTSVRESEWSTRAWTFQEALLSRRCLLFTPDQVYFICRTTYWSEKLPNFPDIKPDEGDSTVTEYDPYSGLHPDITLSNIFYSEQGSRKLVPSELARFQRDVNIYLKRLMGDQNDGLNAFRGILTRSFYWSYYGVPLITRAERELSRSARPPADSRLLPNLLTTIKNSACMVVEKYSKDRRMERMIAAAALEAPKRRERTTMFGNTYYEEYTYDGLPGPGEPSTPDPVLAFLHGLSWEVTLGTTCYRRPPMPTWSWVSVFRGSIKFDCDPDGRKELATDVWIIPDSDVKVWLPAEKGSSLKWTPFHEEFQKSRNKAIPELSPFIKLESRVGDLDVVTFQPREDDSTWSHDEVSVSIVGMPETKLYEIHMDCHDELPHHSPNEESSWNNMNWKFVLVSRTSIYNPEPKWRHMWEDWQPTNVFLVIEPSGQNWKRVGILKTQDKLYRFAERRAIILT
ncbi:heterokaryon incompatibility protein-domain-containing protein [Xylaria arbuscula]|nr:heterokaryon incompatibility protein-domain-containing protein [Xylaria arbuscula]